MLMPSGNPLFENVSSKEYYSRARELKAKALDSCIHIEYPDFNETILFAEGQAVAAVFQSQRWLTAGDELLEPAENKALAAEGRMTAYELPRRLLDIFIHKQVRTMVETELGPYMTASLLIRYLENDKSTCVLKLEDGGATAYVFINFGKSMGAVYESAGGRLYDDAAVKAMGSFKEHAGVAIYFTEFSSKYLKSKVEAKVEARMAQKPIAPLPVQAREPVVTPPTPVIPFPVKGARPVQAPRAPAPARAKPVRVPITGVKLIVVMSEDRHIGLRHRSRLQTLEVFEEGDVAWVDGKTFSQLHLLDPNVNIVLPNGREHAVTLMEAPIKPEESRYIILPKKLRKRLSIDMGSTVEVKA